MSTETEIETVKPEKTKIPKPVVQGGKGKPDLYDPWDLIVVGLDTEDGEEAAFYDPRVKMDIAETFIDSIAADGVMEPVEVRSATDFRVVFGRKRTSAARIAGLPTAEGGREKRVLVPVIFTPAGLSMAEAELRVIAENTQRIDDDALLTAEKAASYLKRNGDTHENRALLCRALGIKGSKLRDLLKLRESDPSVVAAIKAGNLGIMSALHIVKTVPVAKQAAVVNKAAAEAVRRREIETANIRAKRAAREAKALADGKKKPATEKKGKAKAASDEKVEAIASQPKKKERSVMRDVKSVITEEVGGFVKPRQTDIREMLETLRENPFLDDAVSSDSILMWVLGDGPCPFDLTLVATEEES